MLDKHLSLAPPHSCFFFSCFFVLLCLALKDNQIKEEAPLELQKFRMKLTFEYLSLARVVCIHRMFHEEEFLRAIHLGNLIMFTWTVWFLSALCSDLC